MAGINPFLYHKGKKCVFESDYQLLGCKVVVLRCMCGSVKLSTSFKKEN